MGWAKHYTHGSMGQSPGSKMLVEKRWIMAAQG